MRRSYDSGLKSCRVPIYVAFALLRSFTLSAIEDAHDETGVAWNFGPLFHFKVLTGHDFHQPFGPSALRHLFSVRAHLQLPAWVLSKRRGKVSCPPTLAATLLTSQATDQTPTKCYQLIGVGSD